MSAEEKRGLNKVDKLAVIAGGGDLPRKLIKSCREDNIELFIIAFEGNTDIETVEGTDHIWTDLGAAKKNINALKKRDIKHLVFCGSIKRPSFKGMKPDWKAARFLTKVGLKALGDDGLLTAVRKELEKEGFVFHGVHEFMNDVLTPKGVLTDTAPKESYLEDIKTGFRISQEIGRLDIGQSVVVQDGIILGVEAIEGTDALIGRAGGLAREGAKNKPVLIKTCKPQQDKSMDLPTIGVKTVQKAAEQGFAGIAVHAGMSLMVHKDAVIREANQSGLFIIGLDDPNDDES